MSGSRPTAELVEVPAGPGAVDALWEPLDRALCGGKPLAVIPAASAAAPASSLEAIRSAIDIEQPVTDGTALVITTSGSTGNPRAVEISADAADALTGQVNARAGGLPAWVLAIPATSIGGLNVLVRARGAGLPPFPVRSLGGAERFSDEIFADAVAAAGSSGRPVAVSLVPAQLPRLLASERGLDALRSCALILVGGAALAPQAARDCADAGISITTTYGMTETSGGCVLDGRPLDGVEVRIGDDTSTDERIWLRGPMLASRYRDNGSQPLVDGWLRTNDRGRWSGGRLEVLGRLDDIVTVRGVNVDVIAIEDRVRDHPAVLDAIVIAVPDTDTEHRLHLVYVGNKTLTVDQAREWVAQTLGPQAAPVRADRVEAFALTTTGKVDRIATLRELGWSSADIVDPGGDLL